MPDSAQVHVKVRSEDGSFWATVDEYPGVLATGDDLSELRESVAEGIALMLAGPEGDPPHVALTPLEPSPLPALAATLSTELVCA